MKKSLAVDVTHETARCRLRFVPWLRRGLGARRVAITLTASTAVPANYVIIANRKEARTTITLFACVGPGVASVEGVSRCEETYASLLRPNIYIYYIIFRYAYR